MRLKPKSDAGNKSRKYYIIVSPFFPSKESFRGPFIYDLANAIIHATSYEVVVFLPCGRKDKKERYEYGGIYVELFHVLETPSYFFNGIFNNWNVKHFIAKFEQCGIDINSVVAVHCHTAPFGIYGLALKRKNPNIKVLLHHHDRDPYTILNGKLANWKPNLYFRARNTANIIQSVDYNVSISHVVEDNLLRFPRAGRTETYGPYIHRLFQLKNFSSTVIKHSVILYNGVDLTKFYPKGKGTCYNGTFRIGCIANFQALKGHMTLLKAIYEIVGRKAIMPMNLIMIGTGETLNECKQYVLETGLDDIVSFQTEVDHCLLVDFYNSLDLFVLPTMFEGFGCVLTEAYACGVPFMVCEHQGAAECIEQAEVDRWTFPVNDYKKLAELIMDFYKNRYKQHLNASIDINQLVREFLRQVELLERS